MCIEIYLSCKVKLIKKRSVVFSFNLHSKKDIVYPDFRVLPVHEYVPLCKVTFPENTFSYESSECHVSLQLAFGYLIVSPSFSGLCYCLPFRLFNVLEADVFIN